MIIGKQAMASHVLPLVIVGLFLVICVVGAYAIDTPSSITGAGPD